MVITKSKKIKDLLNSLSGYKNIFIVGCGECATVAKTGGEKEVKAMSETMVSKGKKVTGTAVPDAPCFELQLNRVFRQNKDNLELADAVIVMACGLAVQNCKKIIPDKKIIPACDTLFIGTVDKSGRNFSQLCSACGDCILDFTDGYCPITRCPKNMLNGPCGGVYEGKCEVDREKDCVWVLIYNSLSKKGQLDQLKQIKRCDNYIREIKPKTHSIE
jgi:hypothetical protein